MKKNQGKNAQNLKTENRGILFRHLATNRTTSRAELTKISGLSKMTVTNIIAEFLEQNYVTEAPNCTSRATRNNPILLELSPNAPKIIGVLIHRTQISVALCNFNLDILVLESESLSSFTQESLIQTAMRLVDRFMKFGNILGIGIGSVGPVDTHHGIILNPPDFCSVRDVPIVDIFREAYHLPVYLDYHYNCAALAEMHYGNGKQFSNYFFLSIWEQLSLGIITNNQLLSNYTGYSSELGHLCINFDDNSTPCFCGNHGCMGSYFSFQDLNSDQLQEDILSLATVLAGLCNILNPEAIIIDNSYMDVPNEFVETLSQAINNRIYIRDYRQIQVLKSWYPKNLEVASCAISVIQQVFSGNLMFNLD